MEVQHINTATGSASSNSNTKHLKHPLTTANNALLLKSTEYNKRSDLNYKLELYYHYRKILKKRDATS